MLYAEPGEPFWHQRFVMGMVESCPGAVISARPDHDVYVEMMDGSSNDVMAVRWSHDRRPNPPGLQNARVYRFGRDPAANRIAEYLHLAHRAAHEHFTLENGPAADPTLFGALIRFVPGAPVVLPEHEPRPRPEREPRHDVPAPVLPGQDTAVPSVPMVVDVVPSMKGDYWVAIETTPSLKRGDLVNLRGTEVIRNEVGLHHTNFGEWAAIRRLPEDSDVLGFKGREAAADARLCNLVVIGDSRRKCDWRDVTPLFSEIAFSDWPISGPRTVLWCCKFLNRRNGGPMDHHRWFVNVHGLHKDSRGVEAHEVALKTLEHAGTYDGLDAPNLASLELMMRKAQLCEYVYMQDSDTKTDGGDKNNKGGNSGGSRTSGLLKVGFLDEAAVFAGAHRDHGDAMVCPLLLEYVAREVERDASVQKQARKARDERAMLKNNKPAQG